MLKKCPARTWCSMSSKMVLTCATYTVNLIVVFCSGEHDESDGAAAAAAAPASLSAAPPVGSVLANVLAAAAVAISSPAAAPAPPAAAPAPPVLVPAPSAAAPAPSAVPLAAAPAPPAAAPAPPAAAPAPPAAAPAPPAAAPAPPAVPLAALQINPLMHQLGMFADWHSIFVCCCAQNKGWLKWQRASFLMLNEKCKKHNSTLMMLRSSWRRWASIALTCVIG